MQAMLSSFLVLAKLGTRKGLLRYGICVPCSKRLPTVRDAFSEALRAQNRLLGVRKGYSVPETPSYGTRRVFKGAKQPTTQTVDSLLLHRTHLQRRRTASCRTECTFGCPAVLKPFHNSIQKWQSLIRKPEGYYFTKKVLTNEYSCLSVKLSMPTLSINAYSAFLLVITNLRSFPSTSHKR